MGMMSKNTLKHNERWIMFESHDGRVTWLKGESVPGTNGLEAVKLDGVQEAVMLRPSTRKTWLSPGGDREFYHVKSGFAATTQPHRAAMGTNGKTVMMTGELAEVRVVPTMAKHGPYIPPVEDVSSHYFFRLLDDKAVGDYIASQQPKRLGGSWLPVLTLAFAALAFMAAAFAWSQAGTIGDLIQRHDLLTEMVHQAQASGGFGSGAIPTNPPAFPAGG